MKELFKFEKEARIIGEAITSMIVLSVLDGHVKDAAAIILDVAEELARFKEILSDESDLKAQDLLSGVLRESISALITGDTSKTDGAYNGVIDELNKMKEE